MRYRSLGASGIQASVVGLGAWAMGGWMWGGSDETAAIKAIHTAIDLGMNLLDTAPVYGFGHSEEIVGKAIKGKRDKVVLATKCGMVWHVQKGVHFFDDPTGNVVYKYLAPESIRYEVEQSLKRLGTDYIDLYQTHWQDATTPIQNTMEALLQLKKEGKIRAIGVSNVTVDQIAQYSQYGPVDNAQEKYSMLDREIEEALLPWCHQHSVAMLAYSPLGQGLLTGKIGPERTFEPGDQRLDNPRFSIENRRRIAEMLQTFKPIADTHKVTIGQLVIAWTAAQPGLTHVLCGARNPEQVIENAGGGDLVLAESEIRKMTQALQRYQSTL
jgi:methylglyoxal reductase